MHFDTSLSVSELCPPEDTQTKVDGGRVKGIYLSVYLKIFVDSFLSCNINHPISKLLKDFGFSSFVDFCKITSRYILAKAKMIRFASMSCESCHKITKTVTVTQLPEHHYEELIPARKVLHIFVTFVFHDNCIKNSLRQELYKLREYIFSGVHRMSGLLIGCKCNPFKSSRRNMNSNALLFNNLRGNPLIFSGH